MTCKICGRGNCTESFHSIEEQERYEKYSSMDNRELISLIIDAKLEIEDLEGKIEKAADILTQ